MHRTTLVVALVVFACEQPPTASPSDGAAPTTATLEPATPESSATDPESNATAVADAEAAMKAAPPRKPGPLVITPTKSGDGVLPRTPLSKGTPTMMDHLEHFGWTADGQAFEQCAPAGGRGGWNCRRITLANVDEKFDDASKTHDVDRKKHKEIAERMKTLVSNTDAWAWGETFALVWRPQDSGSSVEIGVQLASGSTPVYPFELAFERDYQAHLEVVIPSPDGTHVALVAHAFAGEFTDLIVTQIVPADRFAAEAYNAAGLQALTKKDWNAAAKLFAAVAALDAAWKGPYNLACAYAGAGDDARTEVALREAMLRNPDAVRPKAKTDPDLEAMRGKAWFADVIR